MTLLKILRDMDLAVTVHGFRSAFRDWAAEKTNHAGEVAEAALAHAIPKGRGGLPPDGFFGQASASHGRLVRILRRSAFRLIAKPRDSRCRTLDYWRVATRLAASVKARTGSIQNERSALVSA